MVMLCPAVETLDVTACIHHRRFSIVFDGYLLEPSFLLLAIRLYSLSGLVDLTHRTHQC